MVKTIGIVSLKGGVGKTTATAALGTALSGFGQKVLLVDANYSAPNLGMHFNIFDPDVTIQDVLAKAANFKDSIHIVGDLFHVAPAHMFRQRDFNPFQLRNKLKSVKKDYDVILIDSSPSLNDETLGAMIASDELFVVTTPDYSTLATTIKATKEAKSRGTPLSGLILNKVHGKNFELGIDHIEETSEVPVMAVIPHDINILRSQAKFIPSVIHNPSSRASVEFKKLAATLIGQKYKPFSIKEVFSKLTPDRPEINREVYYSRIFDED